MPTEKAAAIAARCRKLVVLMPNGRGVSASVAQQSTRPPTPARRRALVDVREQAAQTQMQLAPHDTHQAVELRRAETKDRLERALGLLQELLARTRDPARHRRPVD